MRAYSRNTNQAIICIFCLLLGGCTQEPGVVRLALAPEKPVFQYGEPVVIRATLVSEKSMVALHKSFFFDVTVEKGGQEVARNGDFVFICGTPFMMAMPFSGLVACGRFLDVADMSGQFTIMKQGESISRRLLIPMNAHAPNCTMKNIDDTEPWADHDLPPPLEPGEYHVVCRLVNESLGVLPDPIFWKGYEPVVENMVDFVVSDRETAVTRTQNDGQGSVP
jgi:hypothetical protein